MYQLAQIRLKPITELELEIGSRVCHSVSAQAAVAVGLWGGWGVMVVV